MRERAFHTSPTVGMGNDDTFVAGRHTRYSFWTRMLRRRARDWLVIAGAIFVVGTVLVNALFLQSGPHPAPIFANRPSSTATGNDIPMVLPRPRPTGAKAELSPPPIAPSTVKTAAAPAPDPIADLLAPSKRVITLQRMLAEYGYGQIRQTGIYDPQTREAIEQFERDHRLPITGQISERLTHKLTAMTGHPLE